MFRFGLLGSGSSGNAAVVVSGKAKILIDCGFSLRQLQRRLEQAGESLEGLQAVFLTHEHTDHVAGAGVLCRKHGIPIYGTPGTLQNLSQQVGNLPRAIPFEAGDAVPIGDLEMASFSVAHDAADPVSYVVRSNGAKLGFATDFGHASELVRNRLAGSHALVIESNYCPDLLRNGAYPPQIQQRIRSRQGHMSNQDMSKLLHHLLHDTLRTVVLVHLSENNNRPELAQSMAEQVLQGHSAKLYVAAQDAPTPFFEVGP